MVLRRSTRRQCRKPEYEDPPESSESDSDDMPCETEGSDDDDEGGRIPHELMVLLHIALTEAMTESDVFEV